MEDEKRDYADQNEQQRRLGLLMEKEKNKRHKEILDHVKEYNLLKAKEHNRLIRTMYD